MVLVTGLILGVIFFCIDFAPLSGYMYLTKGLGIPFMMQAWWLFVICSVIYFIVSYNTKAPSVVVISKYTWNKPMEVITKEPFKGLKDARLWSLVLIITLVILYIIF